MKDIFCLIKVEFKKLLNYKKIIIIFLILLLSCFGLIKFFEYKYNQAINNDYDINIDSVIYDFQHKLTSSEKKYNEEKTANNLYYFRIIKNLYEGAIFRRENNFSRNDYRGYIYDDISLYKQRRIIYEIIIDGMDMTDFTYSEYKEVSKEDAIERIKEIDESIAKLDNILKNGYYYNYISLFIPDIIEDIEILEKDIKLLEPRENSNLTVMSRIRQLKTNKLVSEDKLKVYNYIVNKKIKDEKDWRYIVANDILSISYTSNQVLASKAEFELDTNMMHNYLTYDNYLNTMNEGIERFKRERQTNYYYLDNEIKPIEWQKNDLVIPYNVRLSMNNAFYVGLVSVIILIIIGGGIVAKEHTKGSIRLLLTKPYKRWKILLSKFLTLFILLTTMYIVGIIFTYLISGFLYGFKELSISLVFNNSGVIKEIKYFDYIIINLMKNYSVVILYLVLLFSLSTITLSSVVTIFTTLLLALIFSFLPLFNLKLSSIFTFIPFSLLNFYELLFNKIGIFDNVIKDTSVIYSLIYISLLYLISNYIYSKRDVKN